MGDSSDYLEDYGVMTPENCYAFRVEYEQQKGKLLRASRPLAAFEELLQEVPLVVWPIAASVSPSSLFSFCENCMQLRPPSLSTVNSSSSNSSSRLQVPHTSYQNSGLHHEEKIDDKEDGIVVLLQPGEPTCWFCSSYCRAAALGNATAGIELSALQQQQQHLQEQQQQQQQQEQQDQHQQQRQPREEVVEVDSRSAYTARSWRKRKASSSEAPSVEAEIDVGVANGVTTASAAAAAAETVQYEEGMENAGVEGPVVQQQLQQDGQLLGGWLSILRPSLLRRLREREQFASCSAASAAAAGGTAADAAAANGLSAKETTAAAAVHQPRTLAYADPLPTEALARAVARIAAQTRALQTAVGLPLLHAYNAACRPFVRLAQQQQRHTLAAEQQLLLRELLLCPLQEAVGAEIAEALLSSECLQQLYGALAVNSQTLNVWGAAAATGQLMLLRAGGVYTLHACMNHSCEPNCRVSVGPAAPQQQQQLSAEEVVPVAAKRERQYTGTEAAADQQIGAATSGTRQQQASRSHSSSAAAAGDEAAGGCGSLLSIETTRAVQAGEELCVSYIDASLSLEQRQQRLWEAYGFVCDCPRCSREASDSQQLVQ